MFICRFRLLPRFLVSPSPSLHSHVTITQRFSSRATTPSRQSLETLQPPSSHLSQRYLSPTADARRSADHHSESLTQDTNEQSFTTSKKDEAEKKNDTGRSPTLSMLYAQLNASDLSIQLSAKQVRSIALHARKARHASVLDNLTRNVLDSPETVRSDLATALLSIPHLHLDPSLIASLSYCIAPNHLSSFTLDTLTHIACALIHHPSPNSMALLACLTKDIARRLEIHKPHGLSSSGGNDVPVWALFRLITHLSELHLREPATRILQSLIEMAYVPPEAIQRMDQSSGDFHLIIVLTFVRSCISWKWNTRALVLLRRYLGRNPSANPAINRLCHDVLYALMEFPTVKDLDLGVSFVKDILSSPEPIFVSASIVRQIYSNAQRLGQPQIAASLYELTQSEPTHSSHKYPLPSGTALTWFLRHLSKDAAYLRIARGLVQQVTDRCEPIPLADRAEFISIVAESGFARSARALWERYSSGSEGRMVAGNATMVVRMCSLFENLHRRGVVDNFERTGLADPRVDNGLHNTADDHQISFPEADRNFRAFAKLVLTRYREAKEPLHDASREDLNALARANVILGRFRGAFQALRAVVDRNERPDLHDVNVVLSAAAEVNPYKALMLVRRMVAVGPKPDSISYGTVIHNAARQENFVVMIGALRLAGETGQQLTTKTVATIIRASVACSSTNKGDLRDNLVHALEIIMANENSNHLATVDMGRFCVKWALMADDPRLAFKFWKCVLERLAGWDEEWHACLRRRIGQRIGRHCKKGQIDRKEGRWMWYTLNGWGRRRGG